MCMESEVVIDTSLEMQVTNVEYDIAKSCRESVIATFGIGGGAVGRRDSMRCRAEVHLSDREKINRPFLLLLLSLFSQKDPLSLFLLLAPSPPVQVRSGLQPPDTGLAGCCR